MPNSSRMLSRLQFKLSQGRSANILEAVTSKGETIGHMRWRVWDGVIQDVSVHPEHRRKGVATAMFNHAKNLSELGQVTQPVHSGVRTEDGLAWSESLNKGK